MSDLSVTHAAEIFSADRRTLGKLPIAGTRKSLELAICLDIASGTPAGEWRIRQLASEPTGVMRPPNRITVGPFRATGKRALEKREEHERR